ncbi:MAG: tRNA-(ms[2]io[6]A)-hydroxylase [Bacteroidetes bacterium]|jgi:tRNA-(ms[2]io[6]A)-hydroxylase|nr:tRNA-(ms[2]io[6]A)-hydroxylase [Bacteroidota bacterium]
MLGLKLPTDPRWANIAEKSIGEILIDHAFCEQKAASTCISLIVQYADRPELVQALSPIVAEEWGHFRKVLKEMDARGIKLDKKRRDDYVHGLLAFQRKGVGEERALLEKLLTCALIEARSCERFRLLSLECSEPALRSFYHEFMVSEAGHYRLFMDLAERYLPREEVRTRWQEYLDYEAELLAGMEFRGDRVH